MTFHITPSQSQRGYLEPSPFPRRQYLGGYLSLGLWGRGRLKFTFINDTVHEIIKITWKWHSNASLTLLNLILQGWILVVAKRNKLSLHERTVTEKNPSEKKVMVLGAERLNCGALREQVRVETYSIWWQKILSASTAMTVTNICPSEGRRLLFLETPLGFSSIIAWNIQSFIRSVVKKPTKVCKMSPGSPGELPWDASEDKQHVNNPQARKRSSKEAGVESSRLRRKLH